jgi:hypothetical protein
MPNGEIRTVGVTWTTNGAGTGAIGQIRLSG